MFLFSFFGLHNFQTYYMSTKKVCKNKKGRLWDIYLVLGHEPNNLIKKNQNPLFTDGNTVFKYKIGKLSLQTAANDHVFVPGFSNPNRGSLNKTQ